MGGCSSPVSRGSTSPVESGPRPATTLFLVTPSEAPTTTTYRHTGGEGFRGVWGTHTRLVHNRCSSCMPQALVCRVFIIRHFGTCLGCYTRDSSSDSSVISVPPDLPGLEGHLVNLLCSFPASFIPRWSETTLLFQRRTFVETCFTDQFVVIPVRSTLSFHKNVYSVVVGCIAFASTFSNETLHPLLLNTQMITYNVQPGGTARTCSTLQLLRHCSVSRDPAPCTRRYQQPLRGTWQAGFKPASLLLLFPGLLAPHRLVPQDPSPSLPSLLKLP